jgi:hypothetical protein
MLENMFEFNMARHSCSLAMVTANLGNPSALLAFPLLDQITTAVRAATKP